MVRHWKFEVLDDYPEWTKPGSWVYWNNQPMIVGWRYLNLPSDTLVLTLYTFSKYGISYTVDYLDVEPLL